MNTKKQKSKEDAFSVFDTGVTEKLRLQLLKEEQKLRKVQPVSWTKTKYRKLVKLPKDFLPPSERKKKRKKGEPAPLMKREDYFRPLVVKKGWEEETKPTVKKAKKKKN